MKTKFTLLNIIAFAIISSAVAQNKQLWAKSFLNQKAPSITSVKWLTDQPETEGKFVLIDFWATWCKPCKEAIPDMNHYASRFKENLVVIGISQEEEARVKAMTSPKMEYYSALDLDKSINLAYEIQGIPHVVLIDPNGIVRWEGFPHLTDHELTADVIDAIIKNHKQ